MYSTLRKKHKVTTEDRDLNTSYFFPHWDMTLCNATKRWPVLGAHILGSAVNSASQVLIPRLAPFRYFCHLWMWDSSCFLALQLSWCERFYSGTGELIIKRCSYQTLWNTALVERHGHKPAPAARTHWFSGQWLAFLTCSMRPTFQRRCAVQLNMLKLAGLRLSML